MLAGAQIVDKSSVAFTTGNTEANDPSPPYPTMDTGAVQGSSRGVGWVAPPTAPAAPVQVEEPAPGQGLHMIPKLDPVDIHFSNITCTVKLGITKGT